MSTASTTSPILSASRHGPVWCSYCCSSSWLANASAEPTVITRPSWASVIPQVVAEPMVRTDSSATPCARSSNVSVDSSNPASSDSAEPAGQRRVFGHEPRPDPATGSRTPCSRSPRTGYGPTRIARTPSVPPPSHTSPTAVCPPPRRTFFLLLNACDGPAPPAGRARRRRSRPTHRTSTEPRPAGPRHPRGSRVRCRGPGRDLGPHGLACPVHGPAPAVAPEHRRTAAHVPGRPEDQPAVVGARRPIRRAPQPPTRCR